MPHRPETQIAQRSVAWYRNHRRTLPWRETRDPYRIWISEIMLQQTQVATVIPYYHRFLDRFPDPISLAAASEDEVFKLWAGLGYYRRARQLHAAAKQIVALHGGHFPRELDAVRSLPGVGRYTAQAILSFAHDDRLGIVEANTQRLYARLLYLTDPLHITSSQRQLWDFAERIVPAKNCGEFNQAVMEIGSQICTPRNPDCDACPLLAYCPTGKKQHTDRIPAPKGAKTTTELTEAVILICNTSAQWLVRRCGRNERWSGLWDFPRVDVSECQNQQEKRAKIERLVNETFGACIQVEEADVEFRHAVTRYRITVHCFVGKLKREVVREKGARDDETEFQWLTAQDLHNLAWNASGLRILKWLEASSPPGATHAPKLVRNQVDSTDRENFEYQN